MPNRKRKSGIDPELRKIESKLHKDAEVLGLSYDPVYFDSATPEELNEIAAFGLPNRYVHWSFGAQYKNLDVMEKSKQMHIYELVLNSKPVYAKLSTENNFQENVMVMAHVLGHADVFYNNKDYINTNKDMVNIAGENVLLIDKLRRNYSRGEIDDYLTALMSIAKCSMNTFQFPDKKRHSLFYMLYDHAPKELHEQQLFEIVKQESEYFDVIFRTQFINEGWAQFIETKLLDKHFSLSDWLDFAASCSMRPGPYQIGHALYSSIDEKYGFEKCLEVRKYYDDIAFIQEFLTQDLVNKLQLGIQKKDKTIDNDVDSIIAKIIDDKKTMNVPQITGERIRYDRSRKLFLAFYENGGRKLETGNRLQMYMKQIHLLWKDDIHLTIYDEQKRQCGSWLYDNANKLKKI